MAARARARDPYKRRSTRYRGISYRERADGGRAYYVYAEGRHLRVEGGEQEALHVQANLRGKIARGLRVSPDGTTFDLGARLDLGTGLEAALAEISQTTASMP